MRTLKKNARRVYYAPLLSEANVLDKYGNVTSEKARTYAPPKEAWVNYSAERGESVVAMFGETKKYDLIVVSTSSAFPVDESSAVWVNAEPGNAHDYRVVRVADSINVRQVLIRRVVDE
jgi:hypothetical protein